MQAQLRPALLDHDFFRRPERGENASGVVREHAPTAIALSAAHHFVVAKLSVAVLIKPHLSRQAQLRLVDFDPQGAGDDRHATGMFCNREPGLQPGRPDLATVLQRVLAGGFRQDVRGSSAGPT